MLQRKHFQRSRAAIMLIRKAKKNYIKLHRMIIIQKDSALHAEKTKMH